MESGLGKLIKQVRDIPRDIRRIKKSWQLSDEMLRKAIKEKTERRIREVRYYDDQWKDDLGVLAHYTTWKSVVAMLKDENPVFRLYNLETANDPMEGRARPREWEAAIERPSLRPNESSAYGCCFTSGKGVDDNLVWWRLYGDDGKGCCITVPAGVGMYRVRYRKASVERTSEEQEEDEGVTEDLRQLREACGHTVAQLDNRHKEPIGKMFVEVMRHVLEGYSYLVKDVAYSDEEEWRQLNVWPSGETMRYDQSQSVVRRYVEGPSLKALLTSKSAITIGPRVANAHVLQAYLKKLTREAGLRDTIIRKSKGPYRMVGDEQ